MLDELSQAPTVEVTRAHLVRSTRLAVGEPMSMERESALTVGLLLDEDLSATYDDVESVDIQWNVAGGHYGSLVIPDWFDLEDAFVLPAEHAASGALAEFLSELHLIERLDGAHWTAFRTPGLVREDVRVDRMELWVRIESSGIGIDLPMRATWAEYVERMILARGADGWALTLVEDGAISPPHRESAAQVLERFVAGAARFEDSALAAVIADSRERARRLRQQG